MGGGGRTDDLCKGCGRPLPGPVEGRGDAYCPQCLMERAERYISEDQEAKPPRKPFRNTLAWKVFLLLVLVLSVGVIVVQAPKIMNAFKDPKPLRMGTYETDAKTDVCIQNLWRISAMLQQGKTPGAGIVCPATGNPYKISRTGAAFEAHCPNPNHHGFKDMKVSNRNPVPELKK